MLEDGFKQINGSSNNEPKDSLDTIGQTISQQINNLITPEDDELDDLFIEIFSQKANYKTLPFL